jgi:dTDP-4-dehydrorhamnose 3,5-epimerase
MRFRETPLPGAFVIEPEPHSDSRGWLARTFCTVEFAQHGLSFDVVQGYQSKSLRKGTIRGLHYQVPPMVESKLVRCVAGAIYDLILDLRPDSPTYLLSFGLELTADNGLALYVPGMLAHGTQALTDGAQVLSLSNRAYAPANERGVRYDDLDLAGRWPLPVTNVSAKDLTWPPQSDSLRCSHDHC